MSERQSTATITLDLAAHADALWEILRYRTVTVYEDGADEGIRVELSGRETTAGEIRGGISGFVIEDNFRYVTGEYYLIDLDDIERIVVE